MPRHHLSRCSRLALKGQLKLGFAGVKKATATRKLSNFAATQKLKAGGQEANRQRPNDAAVLAKAPIYNSPPAYSFAAQPLLRSSLSQSAGLLPCQISVQRAYATRSLRALKPFSFASAGVSRQGFSVRPHKWTHALTNLSSTSSQAKPSRPRPADPVYKYAALQSCKAAAGGAPCQQSRKFTSKASTHRTLTTYARLGRQPREKLKSAGNPA